MNLESKRQLIEIPSKDGVHKSFRFGRMWFWIDGKPVSRPTWERAMHALAESRDA